MKDPIKSKHLFWIGALAVLLGAGAWIGLEYAADADEIARLRRYTPHGHHYIDTALAGGVVKWTSREIVMWKVQRRSREFTSVDEFQAAFRKASPPKNAEIAVHHPALNREVEEGRQSHERAEAILTFLAENGYENAGVVAN